MACRHKVASDSQSNWWRCKERGKLVLDFHPKHTTQAGVQSCARVWMELWWTRAPTSDLKVSIRVLSTLTMARGLFIRVRDLAPPPQFSLSCHRKLRWTTTLGYSVLYFCLFFCLFCILKPSLLMPEWAGVCRDGEVSGLWSCCPFPGWLFSRGHL